MSFVSSHLIRFAHCDAARIAYYPRLLELVDAAIEDWTEVGTGASRMTMHGELGLGMPTADLAVKFLHPLRLGDRLDIAVSVTSVGRTSVGLAIDARVAGRSCFTATLAQVLVDLDDGTPRPWPDAWRQRLATHMQSNEAA